MHIGMTAMGGAGGAAVRKLSFEGAALPATVSVVGSSLASGYGPDGLIAWPAHNLISPTTDVGIGGGTGWAVANGGTRTGNLINLTTSSSNLSKATTNGVATFASGDKLRARAKLRASTPADVGLIVNLRAANSTSLSTSQTALDITLGTNYAIADVIRTCAETSADQKFGINGKSSNVPVNFYITEPQLSRYPMSPDRYIEATDTTSPYAAFIAELFDHFQTTGVRRGVRVRSGVDTATVATGKAGSYRVTYYLLDTDQTSVLSSTAEQATDNSGLLTLTPPTGEHVLRLEYELIGQLTLNEFSSNGLAFGASLGGAAGAGASAPIRLSGTATAGKMLQARVKQGATVVLDWHNIGRAKSTTWALKTRRVPRGEGYTAEVRLADAPSAIKTMTNTFHVRDLIVATGSSSMDNGMGFTSYLVTELQNYNGSSPVTVLDYAYGGSNILSATTGANTWYYYPNATAGDASTTSGLTSWTQLSPATRGAAFEAMLTEIGGEVTAFIDGSGANDQAWALDAEGQRVFKLAQSRKWRFTNSLCGRTIPFIEQELGPDFQYTLPNSYQDNLRQQMRQTWASVIAENNGFVKKGPIVWGGHMVDPLHLDDYTSTMKWYARLLAMELGYATGLQSRANYVSSAAKTGVSQITAQVTLTGGTTLTPASAMAFWRVTCDDVRQTISSVTVGTPSGGIVPVVINLSAPLSGVMKLYHKYGNGSVDSGLCNPVDGMTAINAFLAAYTGLDNGSNTLPIEWLDGYQMVHVSLAATRASAPLSYIAQSGGTAGKQVQQECAFKIGVVCSKLNFTWANIRCKHEASQPPILEAGEYAFDIKASVTIAGVNYPILWSGSQTKTFAPDDVVDSDFVVPAAALSVGQEIKVRCLITFATAPAYWPVAINTNDDGWNEFGNSLTDKINSTTDYFTRQTNQVVLPPLAIKTEVVSGKKGVVMMGDSISSAASNDVYGLNMGYPQRALSALNIPYINNGGSGNALFIQIGGGSTTPEKERRKLAYKRDGVTHVLCGLATNDFASGRTPAQILADLATLKSELDALGIKLIPFTCPPRTNSGNNAERVAGEWAAIQSLNTSIRSNNGVGYGYFDVNAVFKDSTNANIWRTDIGTATIDGIHPESSLHAAAATALQSALPTLLA